MGNGWTGLLSDPRGDIDRLREINDPLGFGGGPTGESAQDVYNTLLALGISPEAAEELIRNDLLDQLGAGPSGPGGAGSASAMLAASAAMMNAQEAQRQGAFDRVSDRLRLLMATDQLVDARRENAMSALIAAAPLMVPQGTQSVPGAELIQRANMFSGTVAPPRPFPTANLPLGDFANAPQTVTPDVINRDLLALLGG